MRLRGRSGRDVEQKCIRFGRCIVRYVVALNNSINKPMTSFEAQLYTRAFFALGIIEMAFLSHAFIHRRDGKHGGQEGVRARSFSIDVRYDRS